MARSVDVETTGSLVDAREPISSMSVHRGSALSMGKALGYPLLEDCDHEQCIQILREVLAELDKGEEGVFDHTYWRDCEKGWSNGRGYLMTLEMCTKLLEHSSFPQDRSADAWAGDHYRQGKRKEVFRFYSYYVMGYDVVWST
jgi:hypothetical protein